MSECAEFEVGKRPKCPFCQGTGEVVTRPSRLMGATYLEGDSGDEKLEPCPLCGKSGGT